MISTTTSPELQNDAYARALAEQKRIQEHWIFERLRLEAECSDDPEMQAAVLKMCAQDALFWFDHFAWTKDPREESEHQDVPMILYPYQRDYVNWLISNIEATQGPLERRNLLTEKSRDMGVSWMTYLTVLWWWRFRKGSFLITSRKEEEVDKRGNMDTPFEKMRWSLLKWPTWMMPPSFDWGKHDKHLLLINPLGGQIKGESANPNVGSGGRNLAVIFEEHSKMPYDEAAYKSAGQNTKVRVSIGTPNGPFGKF